MSVAKWSTKTTKAVPVDADELLIIDSATEPSNLKNKLIKIGTIPYIQSLNSDAVKAQTLTGGVGIVITDATPDHSFAIDNTVVTLLGTQELQNKTILAATNSIDGGAIKTGEVSDARLSPNVMLLNANQIITGTKQFQNNTVRFRSLGDAFDYNLLSLGITQDINITLPFLLNDDIFVFENHIQTLTQKIINASDNTISNLIIGTQVTGASTSLTDTDNIAYLNTTNTYDAGFLQTFGPSATGTAGLNVGNISGNPFTQSNGDIWYDSTANKLLAIVNANVVELGPSETLTWSVNHSAAQFNLTNTGAIDFSLSGATLLPAVTQPYITYDDTLTTNALVLNSPSVDQISLDFGRTAEYTFSSTIFDGNANILRNFTQINPQLSGSVGPTVVIENTLSDPPTGTILGTIQFKGDRVSASEIDYGEIQTEVFDSSVSSADGEMQFMVTENGSEGTEYITLNEGGLQRINLKKDVTTSGDIVVGDRIQGKKGGDVSSGTTITLGDGNYFDVTASNPISFMTTTNWQTGSKITLQFDAAPTITNNASLPPGDTAAFLLANNVNFATLSGDTLTLIFDGNTWQEISRTPSPAFTGIWGASWKGASADVVDFNKFYPLVGADGAQAAIKDRGMIVPIGSNATRLTVVVTAIASGTATFKLSDGTINFPNNDVTFSATGTFTDMNNSDSIPNGTFLAARLTATDAVGTTLTGGGCVLRST